MYENSSHLSQYEDGKLARRPLEKSSAHRHNERSDRKGKESSRNGEKTGRRRAISWEGTSIFCQLLLAWLMTFGIFVTARNLSPIGLELWANQFPVRTSSPSTISIVMLTPAVAPAVQICDPSPWRRPPERPPRFLPHNPSCEAQMAELIGLEVSFWVNAIALLWHTRFGRRHVAWVFAATTVATALVMVFVAGIDSTLLLALPVILSSFSSVGFVVDAARQG
ncbi:hypothetical protein CPLU01_11350 [Colletotrichum plurivorum]|uniref:Uncharacterized protein n=1 Tax=Colletotrichum plurivorum TaxID=2175906 RepID=A0A8H6K1X2_9PEZI|nr:hypothetical protein CPLU01_11350 [Colletotrichum plurivorum]